MRFFWLFFALVLAFPLASWAQEDDDDGAPVYVMDEVVITATGVEEPIRDIPRNVTVITREDIERSGSGSVAELIARQSGATMQNYYGTDRNALVDLRGQGSVAAQNVLVLIDGQRITPVDMGSANLNAVSLNEIERIEIVRGPGGVIYGDRAVGGVINIITRDGARADGVEGSAGMGFGSYDASSYEATLRGRSGQVFGSLAASTQDSSGYRENGGLWDEDFMATLGWDASEAITLSLLGTYHQDRYGMPGGVSRSAFYSRDIRRRTGDPGDYGETTETRVQGRARIDMGELGALDTHLGYRSYENPYDFGFGRSKITSWTTNFDLEYSLDYSLFGLGSSLLVGGDVFSSRYKAGAVAGARNTDNVWSAGGFIHNTAQLTEALSMQLGFRYNGFDCSDPDDGPGHFDNTAEEVGLVYDFGNDVSVYASWATSFRTPAVDEMSFQDGDLRPQTGQSFELGGRAVLMQGLEGSVAVYRSVTSDEIWYNGNTWANENYDHDVTRTGLELDLHYTPLACLGLRANYTYVKAEFEELDTLMPLVPKHTVNLGADWNILPELLVNVSAQYASAKQVNAANTLSPLWSYTVVDTKLTYTYDDLEFYAGVNNLFDTCYATMAFSNISYYSMPTRNVFGGVEWNF